MKIAQIAPLAESVPPRLYGGTERVVSYLTEELVRLGHLDSLVVRRLCVGESRLDLLFQRQASSVAVSLLSREGGADVEVML